MLLFKVGKYEHLELIRKGYIHFNPLSRFRGDGTHYRGDRLEGCYRVDTSKGIYINGVDISKIGSGLEVVGSYRHSDDVLIFCAAVLDESNSMMREKQVVSLSPEFLAEMRQFGQYAVLFWSNHLVDSLSGILRENHCNYGYKKITCINKWNHQDVSRYFRENDEHMGEYSVFFLKDLDYESQNEWRFLVDCIEEQSTLQKNDDGSVDIKVEPFPVSEIYDLDQVQLAPRKDDID